MNIFQKIAHWLLGWQYVVLIHHDGDRTVRRTYSMGGVVYSNPYLARTRTELLPGGETNGQCYIVGWKPVTTKMFSLYAQTT